MRAELMLRSKENAENMNAMLRSENTRLQAAGNSLDSLRQLSEQLQGLQAVQGASEQAELDELRRTREKTENEFAALQKRFKEQEARITNSERTAYTARQTLAQAQQRASEWEKKATAYDGERLTMRTRAEEAESARAQFEADLVEAQSRLEEKDAHDRLARVCAPRTMIRWKAYVAAGPREQAPRSSRLARWPTRETEGCHR